MEINNPVFIERVEHQHGKMVEDAKKFERTTLALVHCDQQLLDWKTTTRFPNDPMDGGDLLELGQACKKQSRVPMCSIYCDLEQGLMVTLDVLQVQRAFQKVEEDWEEIGSAIVGTESPLSIIFNVWADYVDPELN